MKWLFFVVALACGESCIQVGPPELGRIEVIAKDFTGATLPKAKIELIEVGSGKSFNIDKAIPYGWYTMRLSLSGFQMIQRDVHLYQPNLIVRAEFSIRAECEGPRSIRGKIKSVPAGHELFVKIVPVLGTGGGESRVGPDGEFLVDGLEFGNYLLIVLDGAKAIHTETVATRDRNLITVEL